MLECRNLGVRTDGGRWLLQDVSLTVRTGEFVALVGPNGAGKTTMLRCLAGTLQPTTGEAVIDGESVSKLNAIQLAKRRAVLSQRRPDPPGPATGYEIAALGRFPHRATSRRHEDELAVAHALERADAEQFGVRLIQTLSGGEAARVDLARILAQETRAILLDEPTNHLDPRYQLTAVGLCRDLAREGRAVVAALHDLNLAALLADRMVVLAQGRLVAFGPPAEVLDAGLLESVYGVPFEMWLRPSGRPAVLPLLSTDQAVAAGEGSRRAGAFRGDRIAVPAESHKAAKQV